MAVGSPYALYDISLFFNNTKLTQGTISYNPNVEGVDIIQLSAATQGLPQVSKVDPESIVHSFTINPFINSETHKFCMDYVAKYVYTRTKEFEFPLYFNDGNIEITTNNAFILPTEVTYENVTTQSDFIIYAYNVTYKSLI